MSDDFLLESTNLAKYWCPGCEPDRDPLIEVLNVDHCEYHRPSLAGLDDARVDGPPTLGNSDTDGETQRAMARLLR